MAQHYRQKATKEKQLKRSHLKAMPMTISIILLLAILTCGFLFFTQQQEKKAHNAEIIFQTEALEKAKSERIEREKIAEEKRIADEKQKKIDAEIAHQEYIKQQAIAAEKAEKIEQEEIARKKREAELAKAAERQRQERIKAKKEAELKEKQRAKEEKARLAAEKNERWRISSKIKQQAARLSAEQAEHSSLGLTPIVKLPVQNILQNPELPNGCEITSAAIVLNYLGYYIDRASLADDYLPQKDFRDVKGVRVCADPNQVYCGNPRYKSGGYYCFANPIVTASNKFMSEYGAEYTAKDITGSNEAILLDYLDQGRPVIAFTTLSMGDAYKYAPSKWVMEGTNESHIPFLNLHCVVLTGYDDQFFYISDPMQGDIVCKRSSFMNSYNQIGSRAVVFTGGNVEIPTKGEPASLPEETPVDESGSEEVAE